LGAAVCTVLWGIAFIACAGDLRVKGDVLRPGQSIEATNKFGSVRVSYISPTERKFEWDGKARTVKMRVRPEPFDGEVGLYDPAECLVLCRTPRLVVQEGVRDFPGYDQVYAYLYEENASMDWVYTSDGLVVGFGRSPGREQINIDVRQITIHGRKPTALKGARGGAIRLITGR
jgi:hypothetical protein